MCARTLATCLPAERFRRNGKVVAEATLSGPASMFALAVQPYMGGAAQLLEAKA